MERPDSYHQGLGNEIIETADDRPRADGEIIADERLGGLLRHYRRAA